MDWKKSPPELIELLDAAMASFDCERKIMFGYPAYFINKNMFAGLHQDNLFIRLSEEDRDRIYSQEKDVVVFQPMPGRPMKEYVALPPRLYQASKALKEWLDRGFAHTAALPPKASKKKR